MKSIKRKEKLDAARKREEELAREDMLRAEVRSKAVTAIGPRRPITSQPRLNEHAFEKFERVAGETE